MRSPNPVDEVASDICWASLVHGDPHDDLSGRSLSELDGEKQVDRRRLCEPTKAPSP